MANFSSTVYPKFTNVAVTTLNGGINATVTEITVDDATIFPTVGSGTYFMATLVKADGTREIVKVTELVGSTFTVVRGQEGTTGAVFVDEDIFSHRLTKGVLNDMVEDIVEHESDISTLSAQQATNTADIATNTADIAVNTAAIAALNTHDYALITETETAATLTNGTRKDAATQNIILNSEDVDENSLVAVDSSTGKMTIEAGTYHCKCTVPIVMPAAPTVARSLFVQLYDSTNATELGVGSCLLNASTSYQQHQIIFTCTFTLAAQAEVYLRMRNGLYYPSSSIYAGYSTYASTYASNEIFSQVELWKQV